MINYMLNGKAMIIFLTVGLIKKISLYRMSYFLEPYTRSKKKIKVELEFSNYATKSDLKNPTGVDTLKFATRVDLSSLKLYIFKLDIDKVEKKSSDLKSSLYDKLVEKVNCY